MLWGRYVEVNIYPVGTPGSLAGDKPLYQYVWDGSPNSIDIDFDITSSLSEVNKANEAVSDLGASEATISLYNVALEDDLKLGMVVEVKAGYAAKGGRHVKSVFLGPIVHIPAPAWEGSSRVFKIVCNEGWTTWLGWDTNKSFFGAWDCYVSGWRDPKPLTAKEIAQKIVKESKLIFVAPPDPQGDIEDREHTFFKAAALRSGALTKDPTKGSALPISRIPTVGETAMPSPATPLPGVPLGRLSVAKFANGVHDTWLPLTDRTVRELWRDGKVYLMTHTVTGKAYEALKNLAEESQSYPPLLHLGKVYWNPRPENVTLKVPITLTNDGNSRGAGVYPGLLRRVEVERSGKTAQAPYKSLHEGQAEKVSDEDLIAASVLCPDVFAGAVFQINAEPGEVGEFKSKLQRGKLVGTVQARKVRHTCKARTDEFSTYITMRLLEGGA